MPNGLSNHDSGCGGSRKKDKQPPAGLHDEGAASEPLDSIHGDDELPNEQLNAPDLEALEESEAEDGPIREGSDHPLRLIEAHWEAKRLNQLLREVYEEE